MLKHEELMTSSSSLAHLSDEELNLSFRQLGLVGREGYKLPSPLVREVKAELALREELRRFRLEVCETVVQ
jgi:hypothetical protein